VRKLTTESFIEKSRNIHYDKYNYDKVNYINTSTPVIITCIIHEDFNQRPNDHLQGKGCPKCAQLIRIQGMIKSVSKKPNKEWLYQKYIVENLTQNQIAIILNCSSTTINKYLKKFQIIKDNLKINETREQTVMLKYGIKNISKNNEIKKKKIITCFKNYGVESPIKNQQIKNKIKNTCIVKYNAENPLKSFQIKQKKHENGFIQILHGKTPNEWAKKYNIPAVALYKWLKNSQNISKDDLTVFCENYKKYYSDIENIISQKLHLEKWNKKVKSDLKYKPDFKINKSTYLNVDGLYWHSKNTDEYYHFNMRKEFEQNNLQLFQFRADEVYDKIDIIHSVVNNKMNNNIQTINITKSKNIKVNYISNDDAKTFLEKNHINGYLESKHIGLYYNNELISVLSFVINDSIKTIEVKRFCSLLNTCVINGFYKLINHISNEYLMPIHYWLDLKYENDEFLIQNNFMAKNEVLDWKWTDTFNVFDKEFIISPQKRYYKIYDAGQRLYIKDI
jgi:predicted transcriptional regulator